MKKPLSLFFVLLLSSLGGSQNLWASCLDFIAHRKENALIDLSLDVRSTPELSKERLLWISEPLQGELDTQIVLRVGDSKDASLQLRGSIDGKLKFISSLILLDPQRGIEALESLLENPTESQEASKLLPHLTALETKRELHSTAKLNSYEVTYLKELIASFRTQTNSQKGPYLTDEIKVTGEIPLWTRLKIRDSKRRATTTEVSLSFPRGIDLLEFLEILIRKGVHYPKIYPNLSEFAKRELTRLRMQIREEEYTNRAQAIREFEAQVHSLHSFPSAQSPLEKRLSDAFRSTIDELTSDIILSPFDEVVQTLYVLKELPIQNKEPILKSILKGFLSLNPKYLPSMYGYLLEISRLSEEILRINAEPQKRLTQRLVLDSLSKSIERIYSECLIFRDLKPKVTLLKIYDQKGNQIRRLSEKFGFSAKNLADLESTIEHYREALQPSSID